MKFSTSCVVRQWLTIALKHKYTPETHYKYSVVYSVPVPSTIKRVALPSPPSVLLTDESERRGGD